MPLVFRSFLTFFSLGVLLLAAHAADRTTEEGEAAIDGQYGFFHPSEWKLKAALTFRYGRRMHRVLFRACRVANQVVSSNMAASYNSIW